MSTFKTPKAKYAEIKRILGENPYGFFKISFAKKDGTVVSFTGRRGVKTKSNVVNTVRYANILAVYDTAKKEYRNVNLDKVTEIRANGETYTF
jgi:hypothetical protein